MSTPEKDDLAKAFVFSTISSCKNVIDEIMNADYNGLYKHVQKYFKKYVVVLMHWESVLNKSGKSYQSFMLSLLFRQKD